MLEQDRIIVVADYHAEMISYRWFDRDTGEERTGSYPTGRAGILRQVEEAIEAAEGRPVTWIMESTTGWARVQELIGSRVRFVLANVLQMPLPPKGRRRKTDKIDTARLLREYLHGSLPVSFRPASWWRQVRRLVDYRENLVRRQTSIKNWIVSLLHHETWFDRTGLWSAGGLRRLRALPLAELDRMLLDGKLEQLELLDEQRKRIESKMQELHAAWPETQRVDAIRGIGMVSAVSMLAHIGPIARFARADQLIAYAGLAPGTHQSADTCHHGKIGGGGTDGHLRYLAIEATTWLREIPRYRSAYERASARRGKKVARITLARMLLRSIHKMLTAGIGFNPAPTPCCSTR